MGMDPGMAGGMDAMEMGGMEGMGRAGGDGKGNALLEGRYVDENGYPISAGRHLEQPPYAEFKMMMVRMNLYMHQRHLSDLMVECANSAMPVEVVRVRLNPDSGGTSELDGSGTRGSYAEPGGNRPRIVRGGEGDAQHALDEEHDYIDVELFGIIYIYNRPDREKLGSGTAGTEVAAETAEGEAEPPGALEVEPSTETIPEGEPEAATPGTPDAEPAAPRVPSGGAPQPATPPGERTAPADAPTADAASAPTSPPAAAAEGASP
jgi:hypothetical protein